VLLASQMLILANVVKSLILVFCVDWMMRGVACLIIHRVYNIVTVWLTSLRSKIKISWFYQGESYKTKGSRKSTELEIKD